MTTLFVKNFRRAAVAVCLCAWLTFAVSAQQQTPTPSPTPEKKPTLLEQLDLTPDQVARIKELQRETAPETKQARQRQRQARLALDAAMYADAPDQAAVEQCLREFTEAQAAVVRLETQNAFRIRQLLTPAQITRFRELVQKSRNSPNQNQPRNLNRSPRNQNRLPAANQLGNRPTNTTNQRTAAPPNKAAAPSTNSPKTTPSQPAVQQRKQ